jgi:ClpP class serine protease
MDPLSFLWLYFILTSLQPVLQRQWLASQRRWQLNQLSRKRSATVITLIHRQETMSLLGFPIMRYIDIDDAESVLRAIRDAPLERPIEIVLHTPGGVVLAASQIAGALADHPAPVTAVVPHYAMSGGTLIALACDEILLDDHSVLGPVDPQLGEYPAASIVAAAERPGDHEDRTLILADVSRKALAQVEQFTRELLARHLDAGRAADVAHLLSRGAWTHDHPLRVDELEALGLPVRRGIPDDERTFMALFPQPRGREATVEYVPAPRLPARRIGRR